jgi:hypothetical protein
MKGKVLCALIGLLLVVGLAAVPAAAQMGEGDICRIFFIWPKPGMAKDFEAALKKHIEWHAQQKDTWTWLTWQVIVGEGAGSYGVGTFGHNWEDFDKPAVDPAADEADVQATISPTVGKVVPTYWRFMREVSLPAEASSPMEEVIIFKLKYGQSAHFNHLVKKFHEAIQKTKWPVHYEWYELMLGGDVPQYALVLPRANWAAFKPMEKSFPAMLEEAFGRMEAEHMLEAFSNTVKHEETEVIRTRPDLGYTPPKK